MKLDVLLCPLPYANRGGRVPVRTASLFLVALLAAAPILTAQTPAPVTPPSLALSIQSPATTVTLPTLNNDDFIAEDAAIYEAANLAHEVPPYQIARDQDVNFNLNNSGDWQTLPNGDRLWRLRIVSPTATDLYLIYDQWRIVKPCELYVFNDDYSFVLGPYSYLDNLEDGTHATPITPGEAVTLEYLVPAGVTDTGELSIYRVLHGYRHFLDHAARENNSLDNFGDSMPCMINVRCFPDWQIRKLSVALTANPMGGVCSGTMLNNPTNNGDPLFLTANHCNNGNIANWLFYFNYESPTCNPNSDGAYNHVITGASLLASYQWSDFMLLRLNRRRPDSDFIPRYEAWDHYDIPADRSIGIHHPAADIKKIHYDIDPATSDLWFAGHPNTHWMTHIDLGMMEPGSSGSALFDADFGTVVGQLHGGSWDCDAGTVNDALYGKLAVSWEGGGTSSSRLRDWLDPTNTGTMSCGAYQPTAPANDSCGPGQSVPVITALPYSTSGTTLWAANNNSQGCHINTAPDVLYLLQLNCDYNVTVSLCGSSFDTQIYVTRGDCSGWGFTEGCNDDFCGLQSQYSFTALAGVSYRIWVDGYSTGSGNYSLNITGTSPGAQGNAQCPGETISAVPFFAYTATFCGGDNITPDCQSNDGEDVVYNWSSIYNSWMRARTCYINFDTIIQVRQSGPCPGDYATACNDDATSCDQWSSEVVFNATNGIPYYIHVDGYAGATGITSVELKVYNDDCSSPFVISGIPFNTFGDTRIASDDFATAVGPNSKEVFYRYTATACGYVGVSTCNTDTPYDSYIEVRSGGSCPGSTIVASNDDYSGCGLQSQLVFSAEANRTYYIIVAGYNVAEGPFALYVYPVGGNPTAPYGDYCPGFIVPSLPFTDYGNTTCMNNNYWNCVGYPNLSKEVVYTMNLPTCQQVTVSLCGSGFDSGLGVYGGPGSGVCDLAPLLACDDDYCASFGPSQVSFMALANTNYQFLIHGYGAGSGTYVINVSGTPCVLPPDTVNDLVIHGADPNNGDVKLTWSPAANATSYNVYYSLVDGQGADPDNLYLNTTSTTVTIPNVMSDIGFFVVTSLNAGGAPNVVAPNPDEMPVVDKSTLRPVPIPAADIVLPGDNPFGDNSFTPAELLNGSREASNAK